MRRTISLAPFCLALAALAAKPASDTPKPIPVARPEIKQRLEELKYRQPRLPLPELTAEEQEASGDRPNSNNGRMRQIYLPASWFAADFASDPVMTLDSGLKSGNFWIVSRTNNCLY